jgi:hypothetical protein
MDVATIELNAVAEAAKSEEKATNIELLAIDDLDLVGGGTFIGALN